MERIVNWLTGYFIANHIIQESDREIYVYGFDITIYTFVSFFALVSYCAIWNELSLGIVLTVVFALCQSHGGGHHEDTHLKCFSIMFLGTNIVLILHNMTIPVNIYLLCGCCAFSVLWFIPLVLHKNKKYLEKQRKTLVRKSRIYSCICLSGGFFLGLIDMKLLEACCWALVCAALSRVYAFVRQ